MVMVGADLAGIELRVLSHYLARYDGGRYADIVLNGDIHQVNADKIGISRRAVKTVTYAFLYGAGDAKIGLSVDKQLSPNKARAKGKEVRAAFVAAIPGLSELLQAVKKRSATGSIMAIDGRKIYVDSQHKSLNYLIQGSSASIAKRWLLITHENLPPTAHQLAFVHDELQYECKKEDVEDLKFLLELSAAQAGEYYSLRIPIAAEAKSGATWAEVH
jgi:DNA polymerase I-like protein with 3'-5' exonuclease and polymerase domains